MHTFLSADTRTTGFSVSEGWERRRSPVRRRLVGLLVIAAVALSGGMVSAFQRHQAFGTAVVGPFSEFPQ